MKKLPIFQDPNTDPVYLTAAAISSLIQTLPAGTAYSIGIVLIVMMTGRLMQQKGSLARAALPLVIHIRWGWHRVERAMERGKFSLEEMIEKAYQWCEENLEVEAVRMGSRNREVKAYDSTTIARLQSKVEKGEMLGKGYCHRAGRAVKANIAAAAVSIVYIRGIRVGLLRGVEYGKSPDAAVEKLFKAETSDNCLIIVDAGIAKKEQFSAATIDRALLGRLRQNCKLRCEPAAPNGKRGRNPLHGPELHPGRSVPEVEPQEDFKVPGEKGEIRVRRWNNLHFEEDHKKKLDLLRIDDPAYCRPLITATTAQGELTDREFFQAYPHRWPVETLFFIGEETTAVEKPRAWTEQAVKRRIGLGLMCGSLLKAIAAMGNGLAMGPWDLKPQPSAGRLANFLDIHLFNLLPIALKGVEPRNYRKILFASQTKDLSLDKAA